MMQLIAINEPAVIDINKKMSTLGQSLETNNLTLEHENCTNNVSQNEYTTPTDVNIKNETINGINKASLNINGILKINRAEIDDKIENDQPVAGNKTETNGQTDENSILNVDCLFSADDMNNFEKNEVKEKIILTNDLKIKESKNNVDEISSETPALNETMKTDVNTSANDIMMGDNGNVTVSQISTISPNSDAEEDREKNDVSSQLQQLENDVSLEDDVCSKSLIRREMNDTIVQEATSGNISINRVEHNNGDNIVQNESNDEFVSNETQKINLPCRDSPTNDKNNGISQVSTENESIIEEVLDDAPVINDNISQKVDHVIINKPSVEEASNLPIEELSKETHQTETMNIDNEQTDPPRRDDSLNNGIFEITSESESMVDTISDEAPIFIANVIAKGDQEIVDKENVEKASELPLERHFEETHQKETIVSDAAKETNNEIKLDENDFNVKMLKSHLIDVDKTISDNHDLIKNGNGDKTGAEEDVELDETKTETTQTDIKTTSEEDKLNQHDTIVMDINDAMEEKSVLPIDVDTKEIKIETKTDEALAVKLAATEQKVNIDMDIDDVEEFSTVVSTSGSDDDTKEINTETKTNDEVPTAKGPIVFLTDKNEINLKESNLTNSEVKGAESSEVISIDECENDAGQDKPVIALRSVDPVETKENTSVITTEKILPVVCKLSNTMDILSEDEDEPSAKVIESKADKVYEEPKEKAAEDNKCINLDDDDDIMFIEDTNSQEPNLKTNQGQLNPEVDNTNDKTNIDDIENKNSTAKSGEEVPHIAEKGKPSTDETDCLPKEGGTIPTKTSDEPKSIITNTFLQSVTKNLADMTRNELEDFCILKLVESVVDKSNLNEIKSKMKTLTQTLEDLRKKTVTLTKQNRDLQVVVKTIQEDQKKRSTNPMMPMKITRSVGMQVVLTGEKSLQKRKSNLPTQPPPPMTPARPARTSQSPKMQQKPQANIPVPRLVPASSPTQKPPAAPVSNAKVTVRTATPQRPEKRPHNKITSPAASSVTVDLTDDEPPSKITTKNPTPPVRLVPSQNLMPKNRPQFTPNTSNNSARESPRKVYIPISSNNPRPALPKTFAPTPRSRPPVIHPSSVVRMQTVRVSQLTSSHRHPAPLPDAMKQYQPPAWKALPPAPDLKLSKVDNGIVISWKFEGYQPDSYEEVASFQLYAYQETDTPPSTALWKKIGDIKALPLPMACTLTQFMSGFKYYFAVRAIDVRSRIGPFSLPGSIMLISKT